MPEHIGSWIADGKKGVRRLQPAKVAKGKEVPSEWLTKGLELDSKVIKETTCLHIWSAVYDNVGQWLQHTNLPPTNQNIGTKTVTPLSSVVPEPPPKGPLEEDTEWTYKLPDLTSGGVWYKARCARSRRSSEGEAMPRPY
jgi:hypothetical protein